jgi:hypothetical protein
MKGNDMNNNPFNNDSNTQFVLSYEILCLLRWLVEHDAEKLKKIIAKAVASGLIDEIHQAREAQSEEHMEDIQYSILEFFSLLDVLISQSINEQTVQRAMEKNLMPAIDQIDSNICDDETVRSSVEKATSKAGHNPKENPKELLFKELLKRWKPHDKNVLN